ncbi:MAG TPA: arginine deiminase family protein [Longimicrobiaceae bacterium]|nr:arginine deiminase family protein [Longimicrobiaceae bacterium]
MLFALTRAVPASISECELTHLSRAPINFERATAQHRQYEEALESLGCSVVRAPTLPDLPDSVFVEDAAIVLPELAVITRPGAESRRGEVESAAAILARFRPLSHITPPGKLDGGDVLRIGTRIFVGIGGRTNVEGVRQLEQVVAPMGYSVEAVPVTGCLHLKTAITQVAERTLLLNPAWVDPGNFAGFELIEVHPTEPFAGNALKVGDTILYPSDHPRTCDRLTDRGVSIKTVPADELAKAEAGVTCCSIVFVQENL